MSDGMSDCANRALNKAVKFAKDRYPDKIVIYTLANIPKVGKVVFIYEEWLNHIVEFIRDGRVVERFLVEPFYGTLQLNVTNLNCRPGYCKEHRVEKQRDIAR